MVTHQLQVERRTGKVRRPETDVLPLSHATNLIYIAPINSKESLSGIGTERVNQPYARPFRSSECSVAGSNRFTHESARCVGVQVTVRYPFNGPFSGTTRVSRYQQGKTNLDFTEARDSERQWHQLGRMQVCTSLQTDNHASTAPLSFFTGRMPFLPPNQQRPSTEGIRYQQTTDRNAATTIISDGRARVTAVQCYLRLQQHCTPAFQPLTV